MKEFVQDLPYANEMRDGMVSSFYLTVCIQAYASYLFVGVKYSFVGSGQVSHLGL